MDYESQGPKSTERRPSTTTSRGRQTSGGLQRGRKPKLDARKKDIVCGLLAIGCSRRTAARYVGCSPATIRREAIRDAEFAQQLRRAETMVEVSQLRAIHGASEKNWRAGAWLLERMLPDRFMPRSPETLTAEQMAEIVGQFARMVAEEVPDAAQRRAILTRLREIHRTLRQMQADRAQAGRKR